MTHYFASPYNYTAANRPYSNRVDKVIIHVTQGSWSSAINWFKNPYAGVSAHYVIRSRDGYRAKTCWWKNIAWHAGNWRYNQTSIGIEHEGYVSDPKWFTDTMYSSSAYLSAVLCKRYRIPIDRYHIIGHNEVPGSTHTDPGYYWDWYRYMRYVKYYRYYSGLV